MPPKCSICFSPHRNQIDASITRGDSLRHIAKRYGTTPSSVIRHKRCITAALQKSEYKRELASVASVHEVLEILSTQARADVTDLYGPGGQFNMDDIKERGLGKMLKSVTFKREANGTKVVDVVKVEAYSAQGAAQSLLNAYTKLEITKQLTNAKFLSDTERMEKLIALADRARTRGTGHAP